MQAGATHTDVAVPIDSEGVLTGQHSTAPARRPGGAAGRRTPFNHEEDHDSCPFTALRRSSWFLRLLQQQKPTSPLEPTQVLSSFSVKNDLMFYPPPKTYDFDIADDGSVTIKGCAPADNSKSHGMGGPHFSVSGIAPLPCLNTSGSSAVFETLFVPLEFEVQAYHIQQAEVVVERVITVGGPLFFTSFGGAIPCNIIRPHKGMSSHIALFFHCNGEDIGSSESARLSTLANALHMTVVVPEYPGYGLCPGRPSEASIKGAMERVVQYLFTVDPSLTPSRVILIGYSIGTGVAMHVAAYIQNLFEKYQRHSAHMFSCPDEVHGVARESSNEPFPPTGLDGDEGGALGTKRCRHNYLGGIVLLSPFATVDCVESMSAFKKYGVTAKVMRYRQLMLDEDKLVPAPPAWTDGITDEEHARAKQMNVDRWQPPLLFRFARCYSFNRFPTVDVACKLQNAYHFFSYTPILLIHGSADPVIAPFHSVAIASKLRESEDGNNARVFLSLLRGAGHNDMDCACLIRRFYKDEILLPHVRWQEAQQRRLRGVSSSNATFAVTPRQPSAMPAGNIEDGGGAGGSLGATLRDPRRPGDASVAPNLHFLAPGEQITVDMEEAKPKRGFLGLHAEPEQEMVPIPPMLGSLSLTQRENSQRQVSAEVVGSSPLPPQLMRSASYDAGALIPSSQREESPPVNQLLLPTVEDASLALNTFVQRLQGRVKLCADVSPATATMVHIALQANADHTDVGSIMVAALRQHALTPAEAHKQYRSHRRKAMVRRSLCGALFFILALFVLGVGVAHAVLSSASKAQKFVPDGNPADYRRDNRVLAWYILETIFNCIVGFLKLFRFRYGLGQLSKYGDTSGVMGYVYGSLYILAMPIALGSGVIMGMVLSLGNPHDGGVRWSKWAHYPSKERMWVSHVPRWVMLAFSIWHLLIIAFIFIKNH